GRGACGPCRPRLAGPCVGGATPSPLVVRGWRLATPRHRSAPVERLLFEGVVGDGSPSRKGGERDRGELGRGQGDGEGAGFRERQGDWRGAGRSRTRGAPHGDATGPGYGSGRFVGAGARGAAAARDAA